MSGAIMPEPLAKPLIRTVAPSIVAVAVAPFGKVSVVMIARAAASQASAASSRADFGQGADDLLGRRRLADDAGRGDEHLARRRSRAAAPRSPRSPRPTCQPARPVKTLELPELTTIARTLPPGRHSRHQMTGVPRHRRPGEDAGDRAARRQLGQHQVVAPGIADPGRIGGEAHAGDRRSSGKRSGASGETAVIARELRQVAQHLAYRGGGTRRDPAGAVSKARRARGLSGTRTEICHRLASLELGGRRVTTLLVYAVGYHVVL